MSASPRRLPSRWAQEIRTMRTAPSEASFMAFFCRRQTVGDPPHWEARLPSPAQTSADRRKGVGEKTDCRRVPASPIAVNDAFSFLGRRNSETHISGGNGGRRRPMGAGAV